MNGLSSSSNKDEPSYASLLLSPCVKIKKKGSPKEYYVHKDRLEHISLELYNHINNNMKEGQEKCLEIGDVEEETLEQFLEWVYTEKYTIKNRKEENQVQHKTPKKKQRGDKGAKSLAIRPIAETILASQSQLFSWARLYTFADRFNVGKLKDIVFKEIKAMISHHACRRGNNLTEDEVKVMVDFFTYVFDNLPNNKEEQLLSYLGGYIAWTLEDIRNVKNSEIWDLFARHPHLIKLVMMEVNPSNRPPYIDVAPAVPVLEPTSGVSDWDPPVGAPVSEWVVDAPTSDSLW